MILYRIANNFLRGEDGGHGKDLVQLTPLHTMSMKGKSTDGGIH